MRDERGEPIVDDTFLLLFYAHHEPVPFTLPGGGQDGARWGLVIDTTEETGLIQPNRVLAAGEVLTMTDRSFCLLRLAEGEAEALVRR